MKKKVKRWIAGYWKNKHRKGNKPRKWVRGHYRTFMMDIPKVKVSRSYKKK